MKINCVNFLRPLLIASLFLTTSNTAYSSSHSTGSGTSTSTSDDGYNSNTLLIVGGAVIAGLAVWWILTRDSGNNLTLESRSFSGNFGSTVEQGSYVLLPLSANKKLNFQFGMRTIRQPQISNDLVFQRNQVFTGIGYDFNSRLNLNLRQSTGQSNLRLDFSF